MRSIESAAIFDEAVTIITSEECKAGILALQFEFDRQFPNKSDVSVVPILKGGKLIGEKLTYPMSLRPNYMRMSYYGSDNIRMPEPVCIMLPDINEIVDGNKTKKVVFAEGVVETEETVRGAIQSINAKIDQLSEESQKVLSYPEYFVYTLISKINSSPNTTNLKAAFNVDPRIWVHGMGVDNNQRGRELPRIDGVLSPYATSYPTPPYFHPTSLLDKIG